jgi:hypothetical protein
MAKQVNYNMVMREYLLGKNDSEISKELNIHPCTVYKWRRDNGFEAICHIMDKLDGFEPIDSDKPWKDPESLYCDMEFINKEIIRKV